jgi:hypothetical protein
MLVMMVVGGVGVSVRVMVSVRVGGRPRHIPRFIPNRQPLLLLFVLLLLFLLLFNRQPSPHSPLPLPLTRTSPVLLNGGVTSVCVVIVVAGVTVVLLQPLSREIGRVAPRAAESSAGFVAPHLLLVGGVAVVLAPAPAD